MERKWHLPGWIIMALLVAACSGALASPKAQTVPTPTPGPAEHTDSALVLPGNLEAVTFTEDNRQYRIVQLLPRDGIRPIYQPEFVSASDAPYGENDLVMGVEINGDARAYAVGILRSREIVNDEIGGTPVLVTW